MGNIIFPCDDDNEIKVKEIHISLNHETQFKKNEDKLKLFINHLHRHCYKIHFKYFIQLMKQLLQLLKKEEKQIITDKNNLLIKNPPESNQTNIDNLSLNSSILKKDIGEDSQIIDNNLKNNNINHNQNKSKDKSETPDGDIIFQQEESSPPKKEEPKPVNKGVTKKIKKKKKSPQNESNLTPIPEYPTVNTNFDKTLMPGDIILNFNDIPQMDKITEVENSIGGEFIIEQKELLKYMDEYPFSTKFFSIKYPSGEKYSGYYSPDWVKEVFGIQIDINGNKYVGMFKNGMFEGRGRLILHKGDYYEGEFVQNKANGFGKYVNAKGEIYNGYWVNDKQEGQGELILKDGSIYQGQFKDGKKNGKGKITWRDNSYYEGDFVNNYYEGYGVYIMVNKRKGYLGQWKEGKMHGYGVFFWGDGRSYKGYYETDKKHGYGIYSGKNNLRYEGKFKRGKQYGMGRIINEKGEKQLGLYLKGKKLKYLNENDFIDDIKILDKEIDQINNIFNTNEFFVKNKELMNITLDQT